MNRSAARSSSPVLTPGRILAASRFIVLTRIAPAAAIRSISCGVFLMITDRPSRRDAGSAGAAGGRSPIAGPLDALLHAQGRDHRADVVVHLARAAGAVDASQQPALVVVADQRLGLLVVDAQAVSHDLGAIVVALDQTRAILVADPLALGGVILDVVVVSRLDAHPPARDAPDDLLVGDVDQQRRGDAPPESAELLVKRPGLLERARKAVEDEAVARILLLQALAGHREDQLVGHELAGIHVALGLLPELALLSHVGAQHVARGDERQAKVAAQPVGLRSLARSRGAEKDQVELGHAAPDSSVPGRPARCLWARAAGPAQTRQRNP